VGFRFIGFSEECLMAWCESLQQQDCCNVKIATWNVNSIRARFDRLLAWLEKQRPEMVCLQETKVVDDEFPGAELESAGYYSARHGQKAYNGVALLSREPIEEVSSGFGDGESDSEARLIAGTTFGLRLISVYVPNGKDVGTDSYQHKLAWLGRLRTYFDRSFSQADAVAMGGDFNVAPDDRDVYDVQRLSGSILCSEPERLALAKVVGWGLADGFRMHHQDAGLFSWWDYRRLGFPKNRGLRIDHVYLSNPLEARCEGAEIDREERKGQKPSDHAPVLVELGD